MRFVAKILIWCARLQRTAKFRVAKACRNDNRPVADSQHSLQLSHPRTFDISRYLSPMAEYNTVFEQHNTWFGLFCCLCATKIAVYWTPPIGALIIAYSLLRADCDVHSFSSGFSI
jgi:hypothetical protein